MATAHGEAREVKLGGFNAPTLFRGTWREQILQRAGYCPGGCGDLGGGTCTTALGAGGAGGAIAKIF